jgi:hypothetical protein
MPSSSATIYARISKTAKATVSASLTQLLDCRSVALASAGVE